MFESYSPKYLGEVVQVRIRFDTAKPGADTADIVPAVLQSRETLDCYAGLLCKFDEAAAKLFVARRPLNFFDALRCARMTEDEIRLLRLVNGRPVVIDWLTDLLYEELSPGTTSALRHDFRMNSAAFARFVQEWRKKSMLEELLRSR